MKKTAALLLALMLATGAFASCGNKDKNEETKAPESTVTDNAAVEGEKEEENNAAADTSAFTAEGIIESIYAQKAPEFMIGFMPVDLNDKDSYTTYLGLEDISAIKEVAVSESMIGAQAYSLVVARVNEGENANEIAEKMKNGINPRKWVCVEADDIKYTAIGDLICFCMISSQYKEAFTADDAINAFTKVVNGEAEYKTPEVPEADVVPEEEITEETLPEEEPVIEPEEENANTSVKNETNKQDTEKPAEDADNTPAASPEETPAEPEEVPAEDNTPAASPEETPAEPEEAPAEDNAPAASPEETPAEPEEAPADTPAEAPTATLSAEEIINKMYETKAPGMMLGFMPVDLKDENSYTTYLGIKDPSKIAEVAVSEAMMGAQAYSLVVARVAPGQDANAVANEMKAGINPRKWICVEADDVKVTVSGDLICFCMISTVFSEEYTAQDAMDTFKAIAK